jgi:hypothetical protein
MPMLFWLPLIYITALFEIAASPPANAQSSTELLARYANERVYPAVFYALWHLPPLSIGSV